MTTYSASRFSGVVIITLLVIYGTLPVLSGRLMAGESWSSSSSRKLSAVSGDSIGGGAEQLHRSLQSLGQGEASEESSITEKEVVMPAVFQMLPRNTKPPPRGPSPGSNAVGSP